MDFKKEGIRGLSVKQPFAHLITCGKIETRTWKTSYRGWVLICASMEEVKQSSIKQICGQYTGVVNSLMKDEHMPTGQAIAVGRLKDVYLLGKGQHPRTLVAADNCIGKYGHVFDQIHRIKPFNVKGKLNYFRLTDEIIDKIELL